MSKVSRQYKQVIFLYSSTLLGVFFSVLVSVLNTRSLNPVDYGDVKYVNNIILFFSGLLLFGFFVSGSRLLAISKNVNNNRRIKGAMIIILFISAALMTILLLITSFVHFKWLNESVSNLFIIAIPVSAAPLLLNYINTTAQGENDIKSISLARLAPSVLYLFFGFVFYKYFGATSERMIIIQNGIALMVLVVIVYFSRPIYKNILIAKKKLLIENRKYGKQVYIGSLAGVSLNYIAGITLGIFNENNVLVGFYSLALTISLPLSMLPSIIGTTHFRKFATEEFIHKRLLFSTIIITLLSFTLFVLLIGPLVNILYNDSYNNVATYAGLLAIGMCFHGLGDMFNRFLGAHGQGIALRNAAFISGFVLITGNLLLVYFWGIFGAILTKILSSVIYFTTTYIYYQKYTQKLFQVEKQQK